MKKTGQGSSAKRSRSSKKSATFASPEKEEEEDHEEDLGEEEDDEDILKVPAKKSRAIKKKKETFTGGLSIFNAMKRGGALDSIAKNWVSGYKGDGSVVLIDLLNLVFCCAGVNINIVDTSASIGEFEDDDWSKMTDNVHDELASKTNKAYKDTKYPIVGGTKDSLKLRANISEFCAGIVRHCRNGQCYNFPILETILKTLGYVMSPALCVRHTVAMTAYAFADGIVAAAADLMKKLEVAERQEAAELKRDKKSKKSRNLTDQVASLQDSISSLNEVIQVCFSGIFMHRYRDVRAPIREESISALGRWISEYPDHLLDDQYLKYFGWTLNDKEPIVRIAVLDSLHHIFSMAVKNLENGILKKLMPFLDRFIHRITECCHDINNDVSVSALTLMNLLLTSGVLGSDDIEVDDENIDQIDALLFDSSRTTEIRELAGKFMMERSEHFGKNDQRKTPTSSKKAKDNLSMNQLDEILDFSEKMIGSAQHPCSGMQWWMPSLLN
jgi:cohesin complex subunit SA-1/2